MPQFDILSFFVQIIYVTIGFVTAYLGYQFFLLRGIAEVMKARKKLVSFTSLMQGKSSNSWKNLYSSIIKRF